MIVLTVLILALLMVVIVGIGPFAGVLALAALEATRRNGELDRWRQDRELPARELPEAMRKVA